MQGPQSNSVGNDEAEMSVRLDIRGASTSGKRVSQLEQPITSSSDNEDSEKALQGLQSSKAAPEKKLMVFALRLALLEKAASGLGTLGFIWATVVLLGGFAIALEKADFWFVTIILLIEGTRIFSRSHELEWQHETTLSVAEAKRASFKLYNASRCLVHAVVGKFSANKITSQAKASTDPVPAAGAKLWGKDDFVLKRSWASEVQLLPYTGWLSVSKNVSRLLFWMQLLSATTCVALSAWRLAGQDFGKVSGSEKKNRKSALNMFYGVSLAEALLFLVEKAYWQWKIMGQKLLVQVNKEFGFDHYELGTIRRFFYDTYSRCVNGSVFDGLKMDFVTFSVDLLKSSSGHGQQTGARVLAALVKDARFTEETLRTIGIMQDVVERLVEMLNWKNFHERQIRKAAAEIICNLVKKKRNSLQVAEIPGSLESIASLLHDANQEEDVGVKGYDYLDFSLLGLRILRNLAKDLDNCDKIGSGRDLLPKVIGLTLINGNMCKNRIETVKLSLRLLKRLASSKGTRGKALRKEMLEDVFMVRNLRDVLLYRGFDHAMLQILAIETLTSLALEEEGKDSIGRTGGVLRHLFSVFFMERGINTEIAAGNDDEKKLVVSKAGEALTLLALENKHNCQAMIKVKFTLMQEDEDRSKGGNLITNLISALNDPVQAVHAARILRNLCAYADTDRDQLSEITVAAPQVVKHVMNEQGTFLEACIGLAAETFKFLHKSEIDPMFKEAAITKRRFMMRVMEVLQRYPRPSIVVPNVRRFCIELLISILEKDKGECFGMERSEVEAALEGVMESTWDVESYINLSGSIGLTRHRHTIHSLVQTAMELLRY